METKTNKKFQYVLFAGMFIIYLLIGYFTPLSGDDWTWGSQIGMKRVTTWFKGYNGRYMGNILIMIMVRYHFIRTIIYAFINVGIVFLATRITGSQNILISLVIIFGFLSVPLNVYAQTYGWFSGFANYNISIFSFLLNVFLIQKFYSQKTRVVAKSLVIFFVSTLGQLFVEHVTLVNVVLSLILLLVHFLSKKKNKVAYLVSYFAGSLLGAVVMFSNTAYTSVFKGTDGYRKVHVTGKTLRMIKVFFLEFMDYLVTNNVVINLLFAFFICITIFTDKKLKKNKKNLRIGYGISFYAVLYATWSCFKNIFHVDVLYLGSLGVILNSVAALIFLGSIFIYIFVFIDYSKRKRMILSLVIGIFAGIPFLVITPVSPRCFLFTISMYIYILGEVAGIVVSRVEEKNLEIISKVLSSMVLGLFIFFLMVAYVNNDTHVKRLSYIKEQSGDIVEVWNLPYPQFTHLSSPAPATHPQQLSFKYFYDISEEIEFRYVDKPKYFLY